MIYSRTYDLLSKTLCPWYTSIDQETNNTEKQNQNNLNLLKQKSDSLDRLMVLIQRKNENFYKKCVVCGYKVEIIHFIKNFIIAVVQYLLVDFYLVLTVCVI